ncbi:MAG TPA: DNA primase, partial [Verrucomicrobiales bacterium]|nr:DNA primase [Verrucomicrobiales bacterium]
MSGFIGPELVEQIRQANDIVELIQSYIPLKRTGGTWKALCPFHNEKTPSFHVNPQRQTYYCFGCNKGGDVFNFLKDYEGLSFFEAAQRLADRASIELTTTLDPGTSQRSERKKALLQLHEQIAHRWHQVLLEDPQGEKARTYLQSRNVSLEAIKHFQLGYAPLGWDHLIRWSRGKNYDIPLLEEGGLILQKQTGKDYYDRFRGRLMFPIHDVQGRCIAFSGRLIEGDT